ncbi:hypothetical protein D3C76_964690 [compost metagenome]
MGRLAAGELFQQWQQRGHNLVEVGAVIAHGRAQAVHHRVEDAFGRQVLLDGDHALFPADHVPWHVPLIETALDLHDRFPGLRVVVGEEVLGVLNEQRVDVHYMPLDLQVIWAPAQFDQGPGDDVHKTPGELAKGCRVAFAAQLPGDPGGDFRDAAEAADGVVACGDFRPAQVKDIKIVLAAGAPSFHVHAFEQVGVTLGVEDNHHFLSWPVDVLRDVDLGQARFADPGGAQH